MAEFTVVLKEIGRMCAAIGDCKGCSFGVGDDCKLLAALDENDVSLDQIAEIERIVMDWAEKHPEPRYPRWVDVLYEMGVFRNEVHNGNVHTCCLTDKAYAPITADIAEKLGIKPIGGEEDD